MLLAIIRKFMMVRKFLNLFCAGSSSRQASRAETGIHGSRGQRLRRGGRKEAYLAEGQRLSRTGSWAWNVSNGEFFWSLRATLQRQPYLAGAQPIFADYIVFGSFQWARAVSSVALVQAGDPVFDWRERLLDAFGGFARSARSSST
jgi:glutathione S-transferase